MLGPAQGRGEGTDVEETGQAGIAAARRGLEGRVREVVDRAVLPALGQDGRPFRLRIPRYGRSSLLYLVDVEAGRPFVVRVATTSKGRQALARQRRTVHFWVGRRLATPPVLGADLSRGGALSWLCEGRVEGCNVVELPAGHPGHAAMGRAFARVHGVTRRWHHGSFFEPRVGPYRYRLVKRHGEWTRALARLGAVEAGFGRAHRGWLAGFDAALRRRRRFVFIHRRCTESDVMLDRAGAAWILEPYRCGFGSFLTDLVRIEARICRGEADRVGPFLEGYFSEAPARRAEYDALAPLFRADLALASVLRHARRWRAGEAGAEAALRQELERLREITGV